MPSGFYPLLILLLLDLMLVGFGFFSVYYIWNCNLVCIRNSAHVNKTLLRPHILTVLRSFDCTVTQHYIDFHQCRVSTASLLI